MSKKILVEKLIEKIEGEATLGFEFQDDKISYVDITFANTRGMEGILVGKPAKDALVITPRVCGICGHAHLMAAVRALEACHDDLVISPKAQIIRELTISFELIHNHFKWFYLTLMPLLGQKQEVMKAAYPSQMMNKAIAIFAGQYPHNSYAIPGGVVCDPTPVEIIQIKNLVNETIRYFETHMVQSDTRVISECNDIDTLLAQKGDIPHILHHLIENEWQQLGRSYDRFLVFGESSYFKRGKANKTRISTSIDEQYIDILPNDHSKALNVTYKHNFFEVGPLARAMVRKTPLIKDAHRRFGDSVFSRVLARSCETIQLLHHTANLLDQIDLSEPSYIEPKQKDGSLTAEGVGVVEAARGSLIHKVELEEGIIKNYTLITPTQWNLSNGTPENMGTSQKAMVGIETVDIAEFVFKTFDVCSVCTTH